MNRKTWVHMGTVLILCMAAVRYVSGALPAPLPIVPEDGEFVSPAEAYSGVLFSWAPVSGADLYEIRWQIGETTIEKEVVQSSVLKPFMYPMGTEVAWEVTAIDVNGLPGTPSKSRSFTIGTEGPAPEPTPTPSSFLSAPTLVSPESGERFSTTAAAEGITLRWLAVAGSFGYQLHVSVNGVPHSPEYVNGTTYEFVPAEPTPSVIRWAVQALGGTGQAGPVSETRSFEIVAAGPTPTPTATPTPGLLQPPTLLSPGPSEWITLDHAFSGVDFEWERVSGAATYEFHVRRDETTQVFREIDTNSTNVIFAFTEEVDLFWSVAAVNSVGVAGAYAPYRKIRVRLGMPGDMDLNNRIEAKDLSLFSFVWKTEEGTALRSRADLNDDGAITQMDLVRLLMYFRESQ